MFTTAYNTNGLRSQSLEHAVSMVADAGFEGIELSLHKNHFDCHITSDMDTDRIKKLLNLHNLTPVCIATGDKELLSDEAYEPSLISNNPNERRKRINLLKNAAYMAHETGTPVVNFASGFKRNDVSSDMAYDLLKSAIEELLYDIGGAVILALEPEPGMFMETSGQVRVLVEEIGNPNFMINLDIGHVECCEENVTEAIKRTLPMTAHIHFEDIKNKIHYHEIPGEGDMNLREILRIIKDSGYSRAVSVELYDHDKAAFEALQKSRLYLQNAIMEL